MRVLVTGATGFVGTYVVEALLRRNLAVIASGSKMPARLPESWAGKVTFIDHDIYEGVHTNLYSKFHEPHHAIHLAWGGLPDFKTSRHLETELPAHETFLRKLIADGLPSLTVTGTCLEYGMQEGELREDMAVHPVVPYAVAKNQLRIFLEELKKTMPFDLRWVRLFYMYGKGQSGKSLLAQLDAALDAGAESFNMSEGEQWRDYLPVEKVAENVVIFTLQRKVQGVINCCSNKPVSIKQLVKDHLKSRNKTIHLNTGYYPYPDYEPFRFWGSDKKQQEIIRNESDRAI